jgi:hypothetical protein
MPYTASNKESVFVAAASSLGWDITDPEDALLSRGLLTPVNNQDRGVMIDRSAEQDA